MRRLLAVNAIVTLTLILSGCGQAPEDETAAEIPQETETAHTAMPVDADHQGMSSHGAMGGSMKLNTEVSMDEAVRAAWSGVRVRLEDLQSETSQTFDIALGDELALGDSGLTLTALEFVPDFVMGEDGITSRSAEPSNPAVRVTIIEGDQEPYTGWLFAAMPEIHPFPHDRYRVLLVEGLPN